MQKSNAPTKLTVVFASGSGAGPVNNVPLTPGATPGTASYQTGFTSVNMEPIALGGVPPFGADFNGVIQAQTTAQIWQQAGYMWPFDSAFAGNSNIGGYPSGSVLLMGSGKGLWINQADNNSASPDATGSSGWLGIPAAGIYTIATTGGTKTPDPSTLGVTTLLVTGALTSNATLVLPLVAGSRWIIANNTMGSFTLTVQGSSGAGVSITQGSALTVFTDGTAYFAASANISGQYLPINGTAVAATKLATARNFSISGLATAAAVSFDGTGNVIFNVTALNVAGALGYTPANDASVVHLAGSETITGTKTFSSAVQINQPAANNYGLTIVGPQTQAGAAINLQGNGGGTFAKTIRVVNGNYYLLANNASTVLWSATDEGAISIPGTLSVGGAVSAASYGAVNGTTGTFSGTVSTGALTCTTFNATSSDRRLKRNILKVAARPLHRSIPFVAYDLKIDGSHGYGAIAQAVQKFDPNYVHQFKVGRDTRLSIDKQSMAYEQAIWAGVEVDRLTLRTAKLERALARARIEPRKRGFVRRLLEAIW